MSRSIDSGALTLLNRMLKLGAGGAQDTMLDDGNVSQVLDIQPVVRRSLAQAGTSGWFACVLANEHGAANHLSSSINPYFPGAVAIAPYPTTLEESAGLDFYIVGIGGTIGAGAAANFTEGTLSLAVPATQLGWSIDDGGTAFTPAAQEIPLARWDAASATGEPFPMLFEDGAVFKKTNIRVRSGTSIQFDSDSSGVVTARCILLCALMPEGLGQDVAT